MPNINWLEFAVDFGILLLFAMAGGLCLWRAVRRPVKGPACPKCQYSMQMTSSLTCPECGYEAASTNEFIKRIKRKRWLILAVVLFVPPLFGLWVVATYYPRGIQDQSTLNQLRKIRAESHRIALVEIKQKAPNANPAMDTIRRWLGLPIYTLRQHGSNAPYHSLSASTRLPVHTRMLNYALDSLEQPIWHLRRHVPHYQFNDIRLNDPLPADLRTVSKCRAIEMLDIKVSPEHMKSGKLTPEDFKVLAGINTLTLLMLDTPINGQLASWMINANPGLRSFASSGTSSVDDATLLALGKCPRLMIVYLPDMSSATDAGFIGLCGSRSIEKLVASRLTVSPEAFAAIAQVKPLKEIMAHDITFSDLHIPPLKQLENLVWVEIHSNALTGITDISSLLGFSWRTFLDVVHVTPSEKMQDKGGFDRVYVKWSVPRLSPDEFVCGTGADLSIRPPGLYSLYLKVGDKTTPENLSQLAGLKNIGSLALTLGKTTRPESLTFLRNMPDLFEVNLDIDTREWDESDLNSLFDHLAHSGKISSLGITSPTITQDMVNILGSSKAKLNRIALRGKRPDWIDFSPLTRGEGFEYFNLDSTYQTTAGDLKAIARIPRLKELYVSGKFTKDDLKPLLRSSTLRKVIWIGGELTDQDIADFKQQRPDLEVFAFQH
jgi:hypothetical protein